MKITGNANVKAPCEAIWALIFNPSALLQLVPGCDQVKQVAADEYRATLTMRIPALAGKYEILIKVVESRAPRFCKLAGNARGNTGGVEGTGSFTLLDQGKQTRIDYEADVQISGPLAGIHPRFAEGVAQTLIRQGLTKLADLARSSEDLKS
jgi:carbon monoxide dehydrogenase subunit G